MEVALSADDKRTGGHAHSGWNRLRESVSQYAQGYFFIASWELKANSLGTGDYSIGSSIPQNRKYWRYSAEKRQVEFVEYADTVGQGLKYGETEKIRQISIILSDAQFYESGIRPLSGSVGRGRSIIGGFIMSGAISWEVV